MRVEIHTSSAGAVGSPLVAALPGRYSAANRGAGRRRVDSAIARRDKQTGPHPGGRLLRRPLTIVQIAARRGMALATSGTPYDRLLNIRHATGAALMIMVGISGLTCGNPRSGREFWDTPTAGDCPERRECYCFAVPRQSIGA